ncbi:MAG: nucleotidyltransferase [Bacteroidetes bacterium SW_11_45_7]|nr:MAG: nucleotidyltransferase [Bacteroidetes bacterium SW_11_45_7]
MIEEQYQKQVGLLLQTLPVLNEFRDLALHGGTAINLFETNMPRLSIDIDLTWLRPFSRDADLSRIRDTLQEVRKIIIERIPEIKVAHTENTPYKLLCNRAGVNVKIEVNTTNRGALFPTRTMLLSEKAQEDFDVFTEIQVVSYGQLYGGKVVAALDRQHPRDLFDIDQFMKSKKVTEEIKKGIVFFLLCSGRPVNELLKPQWLDQSGVLENQFAGMTRVPFHYEDFTSARKKLLELVSEALDQQARVFILNFHKGQLDENFLKVNNYPAIKWKLKNLENLKAGNPEKYKRLLAEVEKVLAET